MAWKVLSSFFIPLSVFLCAILPRPRPGLPAVSIRVSQTPASQPSLHSSLTRCVVFILSLPIEHKLLKSRAGTILFSAKSPVPTAVSGGIAQIFAECMRGEDHEMNCWVWCHKASFFLPLSLFSWVLLPGLRLTCKTPEASWLIYTSCQVHIHVHIDSAETQRSAMGNMAMLGKPTGARPPVHLDRLFKVAESPGVRWDLRDELAQLLLVQLSHLSKNTTGLGPLAWTRAPSIGPGFPLRALHLFSRTNWTTLSFYDPFPTISSWKINVLLLVAEQNHHIELLLTSFQV